MSVTLFALALFGLQVSPKVSLTLPATSVQKIVRRLSETTAAEVTVDKEFAGTPLVVSVKDVPLRTLLDKMAVALEADVRSENGSYRIVRTPAHRALLYEARRKEREAKWTELLLDHRKLYQKNPWTTEFGEKLMGEEEKSFRAYQEENRKDYQIYIPYRWRFGQTVGVSEHRPAARLLFRILQSIGPAALSRLPDDKRTVFAVDPKPLQRALPRIEPFLRTYLAESRLNPPHRPREKDEEELAEVIDLPRITAPLGRILVTVPDASLSHRRTFLGSPKGFAAIDVYDGQGTLMESVGFGDVPSEEEDTETDEEFDKRYAQLVTLQPFTATPLAVEEVKSSLSVPFTPGEFSAPEVEEPSEPWAQDLEDLGPTESPELISYLLHPEEHDPLSLLPSEAWIAYGSQTSQNLVAQLPDSDFWSFTEDPFDKEGRIPLALLMRETGLMHEVERIPTPGWLVLRPSDVLDEEATRMPRAVLGKYARSAFVRGSTLEGILEAVRSFGSAVVPARGGGDTPVMNFLSRLSSSLDIFDRAYTYRFLAALNASQLGALLRGDALVASDLSAEQCKRIFDIVYEDPRSGIEIEGESETGDCLDPTEVLPDGIPPETRITCTQTAKELFDTLYGARSAKQLAAIHHLVARFPDESITESLTYTNRVKWVRPFSIVEYVVTFTFSQNKSLHQTFDLVRPLRLVKPILRESPEVQAKVKPWISKFEGATFDELRDILYGIDR